MRNLKAQEHVEVRDQEVCYNLACFVSTSGPHIGNIGGQTDRQFWHSQGTLHDVRSRSVVIKWSRSVNSKKRKHLPIKKRFLPPKPPNFQNTGLMDKSISRNEKTLHYPTLFCCTFGIRLLPTHSLFIWLVNEAMAEMSSPTVQFIPDCLLYR